MTRRHAVQPLKKTLRVRMLGVLRISKNSETSNSIEGQRQAIIEFAKRNGYDIIDWAEDPDVSAAKVAPIDRPDLGHWLKHRADDFDGLLVWKLDRLVRNGQDLRDMLSWLSTYKKRLRSVEETIINYDPTASKGSVEQMFCELFMSMAVIFAEMEIENLKVRLKNMRDTLIRHRYWPGGFPPYWLKAVEGKRDGASVIGKILEIDPESVWIVRIIIRWIMSGVGLDQVCRRLNAAGVPTPLERIRKGLPTEGATEIIWQPGTVKNLLSNRLLIGQFVDSDGELARNGDGTAATFAPSLLESQAEYDKLQAKLTKGRKPAARSESRGLSGAIECLLCGEPLYHSLYRKKKANEVVGEYAYYKCAQGVSRSMRNDPDGGCRSRTKGIPADSLHEEIEEWISGRLAKHRLYEDVYIEGIGSHEEITALNEGLQRMVMDRASGKYNGPTLEKIYDEQIRNLTARIEALEAVGVVEARYERRATGRTLYEEWQKADWLKRRELLEMAGITIRATPKMESTPKIAFELHIIEDEETEARLNDYADGKPLRRPKRPMHPHPATAYLTTPRVAPQT